MLAKLVGYLAVGIALVLVGVVAYRTTLPAPGALTFSPTELLAATWQSYKALYVDATYRTIDKQRGVTTSEGQSYTMLRAVWMGDKATFDGSWKWTRENLARETDNLFAWLWGAKSDGTNGVLSPNSASDADSDIALAGRTRRISPLHAPSSTISGSTKSSLSKAHPTSPPTA